ncbi:MAG: DUF3888 domain-containing protein [Bacillota bacterium]
MIKQLIALLLVFLILIISPLGAKADSVLSTPRQDSTELQLQDMLMLLLLPHINDAVNTYYQQFLNEVPLVYPYQIDVIQIQRVNGFRGFIFGITIEVTPVVGPHISVGKDRITFQISAGPSVKLLRYTHLEDFELPPHWQDIVRGSPVVFLCRF